MVELVLAGCSIEAARYAVMHWHYSKAMPSGKVVKIGVWEDGEFIGCVLFGSGSNKYIGGPYGLDQTGACELVRIALREHQSPVTQIISQSIKILKETDPGLRLLVSYADQKENHLGIIYQASNWIYVGEIAPMYLEFRGKLYHPRSIGAKYGTCQKASSILPKHGSRRLCGKSLRSCPAATSWPQPPSLA